MLYTSASPELALLELLTKLTPATFGVRRALEIELPEDASIEDAAPATLKHLLHSEDSDTQAYGGAWVAQMRSLVLEVPSAVLPVSANYLVNPLHPQAKALTILRQLEVSMDPRLIRTFE